MEWTVYHTAYKTGSGNILDHFIPVDKSQIPSVIICWIIAIGLSIWGVRFLSRK